MSNSASVTYHLECTVLTLGTSKMHLFSWVMYNSTTTTLCVHLQWAIRGEEARIMSSIVVWHNDQFMGQKGTSCILRSLSLRAKTMLCSHYYIRYYSTFIQHLARNNHQQLLDKRKYITASSVKICGWWGNKNQSATRTYSGVVGYERCIVFYFYRFSYVSRDDVSKKGTHVMSSAVTRVRR